MTLKNLFGKSLLISLAGVCATFSVPVSAASAATLEDLYRTQMVIRNCSVNLATYAGDHDGTDTTIDGDGDIISASRSVIGKLSKAVEAEADFIEPAPSQFAAIFDQLNLEISADIDQFCTDSVPLAETVLSQL